MNLPVDLTSIPNGGIWIPSEDDQSNWLLVTLHGSEGSSENFRGLESELRIAPLNYLYLNGPIPSYSNFRWYTQEPREAIPYLDNTMRSIRSQGYPPQKTFLLGFSQGAAVAFEWAGKNSGELAGTIAMSGRIENLPEWLQNATPRGDWLVTHGTRDYNLSVEITRSQVQELQKAGFRIDYREYDKIHEFDTAKELPDLREWILARMDA